MGRSYDPLTSFLRIPRKKNLTLTRTSRNISSDEPGCNLKFHYGLIREEIWNSDCGKYSQLRPQDFFRMAALSESSRIRCRMHTTPVATCQRSAFLRRPHAFCAPGTCLRGAPRQHANSNARQGHRTGKASKCFEDIDETN